MMAKKVFHGIDRYTYPGCYPIFFFDQIGDVFCWECVQNEGHHLEKDGAVLESSVNWEQDITCNCCGDFIEKAYGDEKE